MAWNGEERRSCSHLFNKPESDVTITDLLDMLYHIDTQLQDIGREVTKLQEIKKEVENQKRDELSFRESVYTAFPERDFHKHRAFHEDRIESKKQIKELMMEGKKKIFTGAIWGGLFFIGYGALEWLKKQLNS